MHRMLAVNADAVGALPERADRRRRAGGDGLRLLGRRARGRRVPGIQPRLHAAGARTARSASSPASACPASSSPRAAAVARGDRRRRRRRGRRRLDGGPRARARAGWATASRCRATSTRACCLRRRTWCAREARRVLDRFGPPQRRRRAVGGHVFNLGHGISQHTPPEPWRRWSTKCMRHSRSAPTARCR